MISYVLPTRDRPDVLGRTLSALGVLGDHSSVGGAEVVVVDNASSTPPTVPAALANGMPARLIRLGTNLGAASRNVGVREADKRSDWIVMLDDDSHPVDTGFLRRLVTAGADVGAVSADIFLPHTGRRESGGLPEVFIGCGVTIRRGLFEALGGYDAAFGYYVEEYDLAARVLLAGYRVQFDRWFRVRHSKVAQGRDMDLILERLIRNNGWVIQRYSPESCRRADLREARARYRRIAQREGALRGFGRGLVELRRTIRAQGRRPLPLALWDRFTGLAQCREALAAAYRQSAFRTAAVVDEGKNAGVVRRTLQELGVREVFERESPEALVIGTMSPGPMLDALERSRSLPARAGVRVIAPWEAAGGALSAGYPDALAPRRSA